MPASRAGDYYNAAVLVSGPMVAAAANSPYLFGRDLWDETRIPLFEQAVECGGVGGAAHERLGAGDQQHEAEREEQVDHRGRGSSRWNVRSGSGARRT